MMEFTIEKAGRVGLIPVQKTVTQGGKTFQRTYWCKPRDIQSFKATTPAVEFLMQTVSTQKTMMDMVSQLEEYNQTLAAEIYNEMIKNGETSVKVANKLAKVSDWVTARETNMTTFMAGIKQMLNEKGKLDMGDISKTYQDVSYQYHKLGLELKEVDETGKETAIKKLGVIQDLVPMNWTNTVKEVGASLRYSIKSGLITLRVLWQKLGKGRIAPQPEEKDYRIKENRGGLDELYDSYQQHAPDAPVLRPPKLTLTEPQKVALEGTPAPAPKRSEKKMTVNPKATMKDTKDVDVSKINVAKPKKDTGKLNPYQRKLAEKKYKELIEAYGTWENVPEHIKQMALMLIAKES